LSIEVINRDAFAGLRNMRLLLLFPMCFDGLKKKTLFLLHGKNDFAEVSKKYLKKFS